MTVTNEEIGLRQSRSIAWACVLRRHAHLQPDAVAITFEKRSITFAELDDRIERAAAMLSRLGVGGGDRVAILCGNRPEFLEALGAANRLGAIGVPINFRLVGREVAYHLADSRASVLVVDPERAGVAAEAVAGLDSASRPTRLTLGDEWEEALAATLPGSWSPGEASMQGWLADSPALIMYTSGTTGRPKGAVLTHLNLFCQTMTQVRAALLTSSDDVSLVSAPLFHIAGIGASTPPLLLGNRVVLMGSGPFDPVALLDVMERESVTHLFLVPTQWQAVCEVPGSMDRRLRLKTMSWGASPALPSTLEAMAETFPGVPNIAVFGQSEMSPVTCALEGPDALRKVGSVGTPVATVDIRVVDEAMVDVELGGVGEIVYRGPTLMAGYWDRDDATAEATAGGWFHSGDMVRVDGEGFVTVVDRKKDMIISGGENIYSSEVEAAIDSHPKVHDVAVVAVPHPRWVETPVAVVTPVDPTDPPTEAEIVEWTRTRLASYKKPTAVDVVDELPRNASGKVQKNELRRRYAARFVPPEHAGSS